MAVGLGAGVNLGAFTAFLFIDGSGLQRGLVQADKAMSQFIAKQQQLASRTAELDIATTAAEQMKRLNDQLRSDRFVSFQAEASRAAAKASADIATAFRRRSDSLQAFAVASQVAVKATVDLEKEISQLSKQRADLERRAAKLQAKAGSFLPTGPGERLQMQQILDNLRLIDHNINLTTQLLQRRQAELANVRTQFKQFADQVAQSVVRANGLQEQSIDNLRSKLAAQLNAYKNLAQQAGPEFTRLADNIDRTGKRVIKASLDLGKARAQMFAAQRARAEAKPSELASAIKREEQAMARFHAALAAFRNARRAHAAAEDRFARQFELATQRRIQAAERESRRVKQAIEQEAQAAKTLRDQRLGAAFSAIQVAAFAAGGAVSGFTRSLFGFNEAMTKVAAIDEDIARNFDEVSRRVQNLAIQFGKAPVDIAEALNTIVQADIKGADAFKLLEVAVRASVAGFTDVNSAVKPLIGFVNAYGASVDEAARASDILFQGVTAGVFSFEELSSQLGDNLSLASGLGVSLEELAAAYVVLTKRSNSLSESTTQVNAIMNTFLKANETFNEQVKKRTGLTAAEFLRQKGFAESLRLVAQLFDELGTEAAGKLTPNIRALRGEMGLSADGARQLAEELDKIMRAQEGAGRTTEVLKRQMQATVFPVRQAQAAIQVMGQNLAASIAPGIVLAARGLQFFASIIISINDLTRGAVGIFLGLAASTLVATAALTRIAVSTRDVVLGIREMIKWLRASQLAATATSRAMLILRAAMTPVGIATVALASVAAIAILSHRKQERAARDLKQAYEELERVTSKLPKRTDITADEARRLEETRQKVINLIETLDKLKREREEAAADSAALNYAERQVTVAFDEQGNAVQTASMGYKDLLESLDTFLDAAEKKQALADLASLIETTGIDADLLAQKVDELAAQLMSGKITGDEFALALHQMALNSEELTKKFREQENGAIRVGQSLVSIAEFFGTDAASRTEALGSALKSAAQSVLTLAGVLPDVSSPLAFIQSQIGGLGETAVQTAARLAALGKIDMTASEREALRLAATIDSLKKKIDDTRQAINEHQSALNDWEGMITLLNDTVGRQGNGFKNLQELAARYGLTQEEVNRIQEAAIFLNERAKLGIEEERLAIARSLPDLAQFVAQHDAAVKKYEELDPAARGAAEAIKDAKNQAALMTVIMLKLAHALDPENFPQEMVTKFIADISAADPVVAALLDRYGLIPAEVKTVISTVVVPRTFTSIEEVQKAIDAAKAKLQSLLNQPESGSTERAIAIIEEQIKQLEQIKHDIEIGVIVEPNELPELQSGIPDVVKDGEDAAAQLQKAWDDAFEAMSDDPAKASRGLAEAIPQLLEMTGVIKDFSDPLKALSQNFGLAEKSIFKVVLAMGRLKNSPIGLDRAEKQALRLAAKLEMVDRDLERMNDEVQNNMDDMSMWQNRIELVDETIGEAEDGYDRLNQLLATGRITQEEYNKILAAAVWLRERSVGGVLDERAEIAKSLPALAAYVQLHDNLDGAYKRLTPEQQGFIAALQDQNTQVLLSTALMIAQLEALGAAAPGATKKFVEFAAASNDVFRAVAQDLGLLPDEKNLTVDVSIVDDVAASLRQQLRDQLQGKPVGSVDVTANLVLPEEFTLPQQVAVNVDISPATTAFDQLAAHATEVLSQIVKDAPAYGLGTGIGFSSGMAAGIDDGRKTVASAISTMQRTVLGEAARSTSRYGEAAGTGFGFGIARGILSNQSQGAVVAAARYVAFLAYTSALAALQIRSPSRRGHEVGVRFVEGIAAGIQSSAMRVTRSVKDVAEAAAGAFEAAVKPGFSTPLVLAPSLAGAEGQGQRVINVSMPLTVQNTISGMESPERAAEIITDNVWQRLSGGINRLIAQIDGAV
jgi:hypothetical protein